VERKSLVAVLGVSRKKTARDVRKEIL